MTFIYFICFLLITAGTIILLRLNPEKITNDLMRFVSPEQTLRDIMPTEEQAHRKHRRNITVMICLCLILFRPVRATPLRAGGRMRRMPHRITNRGQFIPSMLA